MRKSRRRPRGLLAVDDAPDLNDVPGQAVELFVYIEML